MIYVIKNGNLYMQRGPGMLRGARWTALQSLAFRFTDRNTAVLNLCGEEWTDRDARIVKLIPKPTPKEQP